MGVIISEFDICYSHSLRRTSFSGKIRFFKKTIRSITKFFPVFSHKEHEGSKNTKGSRVKLLPLDIDNRKK